MAAPDRREGDPMSGQGNKNKTKVRKARKKTSARDKTMLQIGTGKSAVWPQADESPASVNDDGETLVSEPAESADCWPEAGMSSEPADAAPIVDTQPQPESADRMAKQKADKATNATPKPAETKPSEITESEDATSTAETVAATESPPSPQRDADTASAVPGDDTEPAPEPEPQPASEEVPEDDEITLPEAPRIEVPVQQQYASLLAALIERIEKHPGGHDLLSVLRMLEGQTAPGAEAPPGIKLKKSDEPAPPRIGKSRRSMEDIVRFGQDPSSEFAPSTIERAARDGDGGLVLMERFLGLLGPHGALPASFTDEAIMRGLKGEDSFPRFLDVFNNRFIQLFYRAWADARPIVQHDRPDDDRFLAYLGSTIGTGAPHFRELDRIDDRLKLLYAGLTSPKVKSAARLKALITGVFGVTVEIDQCVGTWLHLDKDDQLSLGGLGPGGGGQLGADTIVGAKVYSVSDKIRIRIFTRSLEEYRKFLPPTRTKPNLWTEKLFDLIDFYLGLEIEYEIELALPKRCASAVQMNRSSSATLGHIGWLKPASKAEEAKFEAEEEEMLTDTRFRPVRRHTTVYQ